MKKVFYSLIIITFTSCNYKREIAPKQFSINKENGHEYVDLGLSVKWATCNIGAFSPEDYGEYFSWGEITPKSSYIPSNSISYKKGLNNIIANPKYDAARANWGGGWRLPTEDEVAELPELLGLDIMGLIYAL